MTSRKPVARRAPSAAFLMHYPYLDWWIQHYGYLQMGSHDDFGPGGWLTVADDEGICYQTRALRSVDEALHAAEHHLRTVVFPDRFADVVIQQVEAAALRQRWA